MGIRGRDVFFFLAGAGIALGYILSGIPWTKPGPADASISSTVAQLPGVEWTERATAEAQRSVVNISVRSYVTVEDFFFNIRKIPKEGLGSGVIIDEKGYVLTNNHVVKGAEEILVSLLDGRTFSGKILGRDPDTDVAVVKINGQNLPVARIGDSSQLKKGQFVLAIGNPFGLESTVTLGIISGVQRDIQVDENTRIENLIQTDAAINPGNSGGALVDSQGNVVGINTAIIPPTRGQGISFAIPINTALEIAHLLIQNGKVSRPWLGAILEEVTLSEAIAAKLSLPRRVLVVDDLYQNSPADTAGIYPNDVILEINGKKVNSVEEIKKIIRQQKIGDTLVLSIFRYPNFLSTRVRLREKPLDVYGI